MHLSMGVLDFWRVKSIPDVINELISPWNGDLQVFDQTRILGDHSASLKIFEFISHLIPLCSLIYQCFRYLAPLDDRTDKNCIESK